VYFCQAEWLAFMCSDTGADNPIQPGFRLKVGALEDDSSRPAQHEID
jgi:hypothetical protein